MRTLYIYSLALAAALAVICSCDSTDPEDKAVSSHNIDQLFFEERQIVYVEEGCDTSTSSCVTFSAEFPEFYLHEEGYTGAPSNPLNIRGNVAARINMDVMRELSDADSTGQAYNTRTRFEELMAEYAADTAEIGGRIPAYFDEIEIEIISNRYGLLSLQVFSHFFRGGPHGMYSYDFSNYDLHSNEKLEFENVFSRKDMSTKTIKGKLTELALGVLADTARRELGKKLALGQTEVLKMKNREVLESAGYFGMDEFEITDNFGITPKGVLFIYNPYHIASFARGAVSVFLPFEEIKPYLSEESALRRMFVEEIKRS